LARRNGAAAGRPRRGWLALAILVLVVGGAAAQEDEPVGGVTLKLNRLFNDSGKGRVLVTVSNGTGDTVDVDVTCEFLRQKLPVAKGSNAATRVAPHRSDTISVTSSRAEAFDSARCKVERVQK
jgi:hypothetical protein